ncbi:hypothetical protein [Burkholderia gladioli]|uniref:hypothetical protein n=1 Tax=Burkholderia gladioli TaxID=28095 RepID=UPI000ABC0D1F|nr:hypothetical protein [Burkholderia gladioli]
MRTITHNALLAVASRPTRARRAVEAGFWMLAYGLAIAAYWYGAVMVRAEGLL